MVLQLSQSILNHELVISGGLDRVHYFTPPGVPQETFEWEFPSVPQTTSYQVWLGYTNPGGDTPLGAMVISEEQFFNARVIFRTCPPPNICHTPLVMPNDITTIASFMLLSGEVSIIALTLSNIDLNIVSMCLCNYLLDKNVVYLFVVVVYRMSFLLFPWHFMKPLYFKTRVIGSWRAVISLVDHWGAS